MTSKEELVRSRIVQFYEKNISRGKSYTVNHFKAEGIPKSTIYDILKTNNIKRKPGSGRKPTIMTTQKKQRLKAAFLNKDNISQNDAAKKFNCSQQYISKTLKRLKITVKKKQRCPDYTPEQILTLKSNCRWMYRNYRGKILILDDESYFPLSAPEMPGNDIYYTDGLSETPPSVKYKIKKKFEPKVMLYIAVSEKGISEPYFKPSGLAINQEVYQTCCLEKILLPFINKHHSNDDFVFWPDKASSHYAKSTLQFLRAKNIPFVPKDRNPTNLPQCRPIEDFFGQLRSVIYRNGWKAENTKQLTRRIKKCLKEIDTTGVQSNCGRIFSKLRNVADHGPYSEIH